MSRYLLLIIAVLLATSCLFAQQQGLVRLNYNISEFTVLNIHDSFIDIPVPITGNIREPYPPFVERDITYDIVCTGQDQRLEAHLASPMPYGVELELMAERPPNTTTMGYRVLGTGPQTLLANLNYARGYDLRLRFRLKVQFGAPVGASSNDVYFTITGN
jgi:hypothetical protein